MPGTARYDQELARRSIAADYTAAPRSPEFVATSTDVGSWTENGRRKP